VSSVQEDFGGTINAYVRDDGALLLAHYGAGTHHNTYDPGTPQITTSSGGAPVPAGWAPTPCIDSGHLAYTHWNPSSRQVIIDCGPSRADVRDSVSSSTLFNDFASGTKGTYGTVGNPGWGMIAAIGSGSGRSSHASCGAALQPASGGIAYCSGPGAGNSFANHLASYYTDGVNPADAPYVGCAGAGCNGPTCNLQIWVWLK